MHNIKNIDFNSSINDRDESDESEEERKSHMNRPPILIDKYSVHGDSTIKGYDL